MEIDFIGTLRTPASWGKVGRGLVRGLMELKAEVSVTEPGGFLFEPDFPLQPDLASVLGREQGGQRSLALVRPRHYPEIKSRVRAGVLYYETTRLPAHWVENVNRHLDLVFVPGQFNKRVFVDSGVDPGKIRVAPFGVEAAVRPDDPEQWDEVDLDHNRPLEPVTILNVSPPHKRKGLDVLIRGFLEAFDSSDGTRLVIKLAHRPSSPLRSWELEPVENLIVQGLRDHKDPPPIEIIDSPLSDEAMLALYSRSHIYAAPSRSEGFGLSMLEAMAAGCLLVATGWGGQSDFLNESNGLIIPHQLVPAGDSAYDAKGSDPGLMAEPDLDAMIELLRRAVKFFSTYRDLRRTAVMTAAKYNWRRAARAVMNAFRALE